ncbi:MAG: DUF1109 domain-containing protein [Rhodoferax sp.]|nr:DUF1109 domain-containing protein [Rhodoferax sp.]
MKTEDLIGLLAAGETRVAPHLVRQRFAAAMGWSIPLAALVMVSVYGLRGDLVQALSGTVFWMKLAFAGALALFAGLATDRLGRPGMRVAGVWAGLAAPVVLLWLAAAAALLGADPAERAELVFGSSWRSCPFNIALISLPLFAAMLWFVKGMAPTEPALAGASAGLLSGAVATLIYALHCPESSVTFVGIWYVLGIAIPTLVGAALGPRLLRW